MAASEVQPWGACYRILIGFLVLPVYDHFGGADRSIVGLTVFFLGVLLALRLLPAILRRLLPFSKELQGVWSERRQLAKRRDSYQWQKLLWLGLGLSACLGFRGDIRGPELLLAIVCLVLGGIGLAVWMAGDRGGQAAVPASSRGK